MRLLNAADVRTALPMSEAIAAMREAFAAVSAGRAQVPLRTHIGLDGERGGGGGATLTMPAAMTEPVRLGTKLLTIFPANPARGLPLIQGVVVIFDAETGRPLGVLEGMTLTAIRTGAASGLATDVLARPDASRVAIIGSGVQARTQLEAVCCVRDIDHVAVYSQTPEHAARFAEEMGPRPDVPGPVQVAHSAIEAVAGADIICTATTAASPVITGTDASDGVHVNAVGSYTLEMQELGADLLSRARLVVDQVAATLQEAGEVVAAVRSGSVREEDLIELGAIVNGVARGRERSDEVTVFKSVGLAVQDLCGAGRALERAEAEGVGTVIDM